MIALYVAKDIPRKDQRTLSHRTIDCADSFKRKDSRELLFIVSEQAAGPANQPYSTPE